MSVIFVFQWQSFLVCGEDIKAETSRDTTGKRIIVWHNWASNYFRLHAQEPERKLKHLLSDAIQWCFFINKTLCSLLSKPNYIILEIFLLEMFLLFTPKNGSKKRFLDVEKVVALSVKY